jgi:hypothetical protein
MARAAAKQSQQSYTATGADKKALDLFTRLYQLAEPQHKRNVTYYRECWDRYLAEVKNLDALPEWKSKLHPPYLLRAAETMYAQLAQLNPETAIEPMTPDDVEAAEAMELIVQEQQNVDGTAWKEQLVLKTAIILGISACKVSWAVEQIEYEEEVEVPSVDDQGNEILDPETGQPQTELQMKPCTKVVKNQPTQTICDMHDLLYDPYARHPDELGFVLWRTWSTPEAIKARGSINGPDGQPIYRNTAYLPEPGATGGEADSQARDTRNEQRNTKGRIPIWEAWIKDEKGIRLLTIAGQGEVLLRDVRNIYRHGQLPFAWMVTLPDLFSMRGISELWAAKDLQTLKWSQMNQRVDNSEFINNMSYFVRKTGTNTKPIPIFPGVQIPVDDASDVTPIYPRSTLVGPMEASERATLGEIDDLMGTGALMSGNDPRVDPRTASEATGIRTAAQRRMAAKQNLYIDMRVRIGTQWVELNQQLMDEALWTKTVGRGTDRWDFQIVVPMQLRSAQLRFKVRSADDQLLDEERRTKAMQLFNTIIAAVPNLQILAQVTGKLFMPNGEELMLELFRSFGVTEAKRLVTQMMPPAPPPMPGPPMPGGAGPVGNGGPPPPPQAQMPALAGAPQLGS